MKIAFLLAALAVIGGPVGVEDGEKERPSEMADMRLIEGGTFRMGDVFEEGVRFATPVHDVTISTFHLNRYEVSVEEFAAFVEETGHVTSAERKAAEGAAEGLDEYQANLVSLGAWVLKPGPSTSWVDCANWKDPQFEQSASDPVTCVSWRDAVSYCNWLSAREGLPAAYDVETGKLLNSEGQPTTDVALVKGYRLPTEAEWEYAAREGGKKVRFGNGKDIARPGEINFNAAAGEFDYAEKGECRKGTVPVGSFGPNALGLHDMSGNVWEWRSDFVGQYSDKPQTDPYQSEGMMGSRRAARGGPWVGDAGLARISVRLGWVADDRCNNIGFRIARSK